MGEIYITNNVVIYNDMEKGWVRGKYQPFWHDKVYYMWRHMWKRVYGDIHYFGSLIHPSFKYLSNYVDWIKTQPNFDDFCKTCDRVRWGIDKDSKCLGNKNYYPEYMTLMTQSNNCRERNNRNGNPFLNRKKPILGVSLDNAKKIILAMSTKDVWNYGFDPSSVGKCAKNKWKSYKGYKWFRVNYKHNKTYRIKGEW